MHVDDGDGDDGPDNDPGDGPDNGNGPYGDGNNGPGGPDGDGGNDSPNEGPGDCDGGHEGGNDAGNHPSFGPGGARPGPSSGGGMLGAAQASSRLGSGGARSSSAGPVACGPGPAGPPSEGAVLDNLWCRHAFEFFRIVSIDNKADSVESKATVVYSVGPHLPGQRAPLWDTLDALANPEPQSSAKSALSFNFQSEAPASRLHELPEHNSYGQRVPAIHAFTILRERVQFHVPALATNVSGVDKMVISSVTVTDVDKGTQRLHVDLESVDGSAVDSLHVITPHTWTRDEWMTLRSWSAAADLHYHIGVSVVASSEPAMQEVLRALLDTRVLETAEHSREPYIVLQTDPLRETKIALLILLEDTRA